jgi:hypothetical protein
LLQSTFRTRRGHEKRANARMLLQDQKRRSQGGALAA